MIIIKSNNYVGIKTKSAPPKEYAEKVSPAVDATQTILQQGKYRETPFTKVFFPCKEKFNLSRIVILSHKASLCNKYLRAVAKNTNIKAHPQKEYAENL